MPACVLMCSVAENNKEEGPLHFHVFVDESVGDEERQHVITTANNYDINVDFYRIDKSMFDGWYLGHLSVAAYYRLILEDILPQNIHRVIYLDCDMIVRHSLMPLWEMDLEGKALAAVPDLSEAVPERYQRLGYPAREGYFNSGMLVINVDYWREHNLKKVFLEYFTHNMSRCLQHDQDVLNVCCLDSKKVIDLKWNCQDGFFYTRKYISVERYRDQWQEALTKPVVLHYTAAKPWEVGCDHPYKDEFFKYQQKTIWRDATLWPPRCPLTAKQKLVRFLRSVHLLQPRYQLVVKKLG
jgi:lipopolysaccharide biosynthesis glycosyltransferase